MRTVGAGVFFVLLARVFAHEAMYRFAMGVLMLGWRIFSQSPASFLTHVRNLWSESQRIIVTAYIPLPFLATDIVRSLGRFFGQRLMASGRASSLQWRLRLSSSPSSSTWGSCADVLANCSLGPGIRGAYLGGGR